MPGMHTELRLVRGVQGAPGDTGSAEIGYTIIDLLAGASEGFALQSEPGAWNPAVPAPKSGLWIDVPFLNGRTPYTTADSNVTETMQLTVTAPTHLRMSQLLRDLYGLIENCNRYWDDEFYGQPTFLHWWATGAPGRQYALIFTIDADVSVPTDADENTIVRDVTLTIEREPYWRAEVPPGANPIYWTLFAQNKLPGLNYDYLADLRIMATPSVPLLYSLVSDTLENKLQYTNLLTNANVLSAENRLNIPAAKIPGDAPALLQLSLRRSFGQGATPQNFNYMVACSTRLTTRTARDGNISRFVTMIPFTAGAYGAAALQTDTGGIGGYNITTSTTIAASRVAITPGVMGVSWTGTIALDKSIQRGRFAVFVRCRQNAGSSGDITLRVRAAYDASGSVGASMVTDTVIAPLQAGTGNTTTWPVVYCGSLRLPLDRETTLSTLGSVGGSGQFNATRDSLFILLETARSTGVALLYFLDVILMPYDEALLDTEVIAPFATAGSVVEAMVFDNTGYLTRGKPEQIVVGMNVMNLPLTEIDAFQNAIEQRGAQLTLEPGIDNQIYVFERNQDNESQAFSTIEASVNIVPRWRGIRSV